MLIIFIIFFILFILFFVFYKTEYFITKLTPKNENDFINSLNTTLNYEEATNVYYNVKQENNCIDRKRDCIVACINYNNKLDIDCYNSCLMTAYNC